MDAETKQTIESLLTEARAGGKWLLVGDVKFATAGIPKIAGEGFLFPTGSAIMTRSGKMGGALAEYETLPNPRWVSFGAVCTIDMCPPAPVKK